MLYTPTADESDALGQIYQSQLPALADDPALTPSPTASYNAATAQWESNGNPNAKNPASSASGKYQLTDGSYQNTLRNHPNLAGLDKNSDEVMNAYTGDNTASLAPMIGRDPTPLDLHAAHFLGANGAARFLTADPNSPAYQAASPEAVAANRNVFFDKSGKPYTVAQVYGAAARQFNMPPEMPKPGPNATGPIATTAQASMTSSPASGSPVQTQGFPSGTQNMFPSADSVFGQQKSDIAAYIASQPQMFAKLQALQDQYKKSTQPSFLDKFGDVMNSFNQLNAVAQANKLASAGGIANRANPDASQFVQALQNQHTADLAARQQKIDQAKTGYDLDSGLLSAQNQAALGNLGLTGGLADKAANYGFETQKAAMDYGLQSSTRALELAKFNNQQIVDVNNYLEKAVPNPETRAKVALEFASTANPNAGLAANTKLIDGIIAKQQADGSQISVKEPAKMMQIETYDPTANGGTGGPKREVVNTATPAGQARLNEVMKTTPDAKITDLGANSNTVNVNTGSSESGGGKNASSLADQHLAALTMGDNANAALALLDYLQNHGGVGTLTNADASVELQKKIKQLTGLDPTAVDARQVYDKLVNKIQSSESLAQLKGVGGRPSDNEFKTFQSGALGSTATYGAARAYLQHVADSADWNRRSVENQSDAKVKALQTQNGYYDPENAQIKWQSDPNNRPPVWDTKPLTTPKPPLVVPPGAIADPKDGSLWQKNANGDYVKVQ